MRKFINSGLAALTLLISSSAFALTPMRPNSRDW